MMPRNIPRLIGFATISILSVFAQASAAFGIPPFYKEFEELLPLEHVKSAKCNICHTQNQKKSVRNPFGLEVGKVLTRGMFKPQPPPAVVKKLIQDGLKKALQEKAPDGSVWEEVFRGGLLPADVGPVIPGEPIPGDS